MDPICGLCRPRGVLGSQVKLIRVWGASLKVKDSWKFPGSQCLGLRAFTARTQVHSLVGELGSRVTHGAAKKKKKKDPLTIFKENDWVIGRPFPEISFWFFRNKEQGRRRRMEGK